MIALADILIVLTFSLPMYLTLIGNRWIIGAPVCWFIGNYTYQSRTPPPSHLLPLFQFLISLLQQVSQPLLYPPLPSYLSSFPIN